MNDNGLRQPKRFITDHDNQGKAIFNDQVTDNLEWQQLKNGARFSLGYTTDQFPVTLTDRADLESYQQYCKDLPGVTIPGGTVLRYVDMPPGRLSPMHRTISLDYGVVLEGQVELVLDSGEVRLMHRGDVAIQRGTNHAWRNASDTEWARMMYVLQEAHPISIGGQGLKEDYGGGMDDVKPSARRNGNESDR